MNSDEFIASGVLEAYAMGQATEQEAKLVVEMGARYPEVKAELRAIEAALENFDKQNAVEPPNHLKAKILAKVSASLFSVPTSENGKTEANVISITQPKQNNFFKYAAAILLLFSVGSGLYIIILSESKRTYVELYQMYERDNSELGKQLRATSDSVQRMRSDLALLKKPSMKSIELKGMEEAPDAKAMVYANTATGDSYLEIMSLPPAPEGMQYQFWGFVDGKPVDAGMIPLDGDLAGVHAMKTIPGSTGYAITLETKGGHPQPAGKIFVMGNV